VQSLNFLDLWAGTLNQKSAAWNNQSKFIFSKHKNSCYVGGFGSGKTLAGSFKVYLLANHIPGNRIIVLRRTYRELMDSTYRTFMEWLPPELFAGEKKSEDIVYIRDRTGGVSEVLFRSLNKPEKFKSIEIGAFWIDEATEATETEFQFLIGRLRLNASRHYRPSLLTTNPCPKSHWIYKKFGPGNADKSLDLLLQTSTYENRDNLPPGYIEELERTYPSDWIEMYLKGHFGITLEGVPVFPNFRGVTQINGVNVNWHIAPQPLDWDRNLPLKRGWDPGRVRPATVVWQISKTQQWQKLWEFLGHNQPGNIYIPLVKNLLADRFPGGAWQDYMDPQGFERSKVDDRSWYDELVHNGINPIKIPRTSPSSRADVFNRMLSETNRDSQPKILIDPMCEIGIEAYRGGYHRAKPEFGKAISDDPIKDGYYEHIVDADGYLLVGTYEGNLPSSPFQRGNLRRAAKKRSLSYGGKPKL